METDLSILNRIASALEKIAEALHPDTRKEAIEEAARHRLAKSRKQAWDDADCDYELKQAKKKFYSWLGDASGNLKECAFNALRTKESLNWLGKNAEQIVEFCRSFDPATYDWKAMWGLLTPKAREAIEKRLGKHE